jgi:hypothetical protein
VSVHVHGQPLHEHLAGDGDTVVLPVALGLLAGSVEHVLPVGDVARKDLSSLLVYQSDVSVHVEDHSVRVLHQEPRVLHLLARQNDAVLAFDSDDRAESRPRLL